MPEQPTVGTAAPDFALTAHNGVEVQLSEYQGQKNIILYFMREFT